MTEISVRRRKTKVASKILKLQNAKVGDVLYGTELVYYISDSHSCSSKLNS